MLVDRSDLWKGKPVKNLTEGLSQKGGRNSDGRITMRHRGGGHKRRYRKIDFKRRKFDVPATVERLGVRPQPLGLHRADPLRRRRAGLHPRPAAGLTGRQGGLRRPLRHQAGQRDADEQHPRRHHHPQCRDEAGEGRPDRALRRQLRAAGRQGSGLRPAQAAVGRAAHRAWAMHGHHRRCLQPRQSEHQSGQGRPHALEGPAAPRCAASP